MAAPRINASQSLLNRLRTALPKPALLTIVRALCMSFVEKKLVVVDGPWFRHAVNGAM